MLYYEIKNRYVVLYPADWCDAHPHLARAARKAHLQVPSRALRAAKRTLEGCREKVGLKGWLCRERSAEVSAACLGINLIPMPAWMR